MSLRLVRFWVLLAVGAIPGAALGANDSPACPLHGCESSRIINPFHRAGHPEYVRSLAVPSNTPRYGGYYVGGGLPVKGGERCIYHDGTWGWDYYGILFPKRIALHWSHGARYQGGSGAYKTDGPRLKHE